MTIYNNKDNMFGGIDKNVYYAIPRTKRNKRSNYYDYDYKYDNKKPYNIYIDGKKFTINNNTSRKRRNKIKTKIKTTDKNGTPIPNTLTLFINTAISGYSKLIYNPSMTIPYKSYEELVIHFNPLIKLDKEVIKKESGEKLYTQFFKKDEFEGLIRRTLSYKMQKNRTLQEAKEEGIIEHNIKLVMETLFKQDNDFYLKNTKYLVNDYSCNYNEWIVDTKMMKYKLFGKYISEYDFLEQQEADKELKQIPKELRSGVDEKDLPENLSKELKDESTNKTVTPINLGEKNIFNNSEMRENIPESLKIIISNGGMYYDNDCALVNSLSQIILFSNDTTFNKIRSTNKKLNELYLIMNNSLMQYVDAKNKFDIEYGIVKKDNEKSIIELKYIFDEKIVKEFFIYIRYLKVTLKKTYEEIINDTEVYTNIEKILGQIISFNIKFSKFIIKSYELLKNIFGYQFKLLYDKYLFYLELFRVYNENNKYKMYNVNIGNLIIGSDYKTYYEVLYDLKSGYYDFMMSFYDKTEKVKDANGIEQNIVNKGSSTMAIEKLTQILNKKIYLKKEFELYYNNPTLLNIEKNYYNIYHQKLLFYKNKNLCLMSSFFKSKIEVLFKKIADITDEQLKKTAKINEEYNTTYNKDQVELLNNYLESKMNSSYTRFRIYPKMKFYNQEALFNKLQNNFVLSYDLLVVYMQLNINKAEKEIINLNNYLYYAVIDGELARSYINYYKIISYILNPKYNENHNIESIYFNLNEKIDVKNRNLLEEQVELSRTQMNTDKTDKKKYKSMILKWENELKNIINNFVPNLDENGINKTCNNFLPPPPPPPQPPINPFKNPASQSVPVDQSQASSQPEQTQDNTKPEVPKNKTKIPKTKTKIPKTKTKVPETENKPPETENKPPETETKVPETETKSEVKIPEQKPEVEVVAEEKLNQEFSNLADAFNINNQEPVEEVIQEPVKEVIQGPIKIIEEPVKIVEKPVEEVIQEPVEEVIQEPVKEVIQGPIKEVIQEPVKEVIQGPVEVAEKPTEIVKELKKYDFSSTIYQNYYANIIKKIDKNSTEIIQNAFKYLVDSYSRNIRKKMLILLNADKNNINKFKVIDNEGAGDCLFAAVKDAINCQIINSGNRDFLPSEFNEKYTEESTGLTTVTLLRELIAYNLTEDMYNQIVDGANISLGLGLDINDPIRRQYNFAINNDNTIKTIDQIKETMKIFQGNYWGDAYSVIIFEDYLKIKLIIFDKRSYSLTNSGVKYNDNGEQKIGIINKIKSDNTTYEITNLNDIKAKQNINKNNIEENIVIPSILCSYGTQNNQHIDNFIYIYLTENNGTEHYEFIGSIDSQTVSKKNNFVFESSKVETYIKYLIYLNCYKNIPEDYKKHQLFSKIESISHSLREIDRSFKNKNNIKIGGATNIDNIYNKHRQFDFDNENYRLSYYIMMDLSIVRKGNYDKIPLDLKSKLACYNKREKIRKAYADMFDLIYMPSEFETEDEKEKKKKEEEKKKKEEEKKKNDEEKKKKEEEKKKKEEEKKNNYLFM